MKSFKFIGTYVDNLLDVPYDLVHISAKELSEYLKLSLKEKGIDYTLYDIHSSDTEGLTENPPQEIYEYQNFTLMRKENGEYLLMDGFRRLLKYDAPDIPVLVKIYPEIENTDILKIMISLNHFKFYGISNFYDRGFALIMRMFFNIDIFKAPKIFKSYLSSNDSSASYSGGRSSTGKTQLNSVTKRILQPRFVNDIQFLIDLKEAGEYVNNYVSILLLEQPDFEYKANEFVKILREQPTYESSTKKLQRKNTTHKIDEQNEMLILYKKVFQLVRGEEAEETYAEQYEKIKNLSKDFAKNKEWIKLSKNRNLHVVHKIIKKLHNEGNLEFKCFVYPSEKEFGYSLDNKQQPHKAGVYEDNAILHHYTKPKHFTEGYNPIDTIRVTFEDGRTASMRGKSTYKNNLYTSLDTNDCDLYMKFPKKRLSEIIKNREWIKWITN